MQRRRLFKITGALALTATPLSLVFRRSELDASEASSSLRRDPKGIIDLLDGLSYRVLDQALSPMTDGLRVPARPDGMACFPGPNQTWVLMRNHEVDRNAALGAYMNDVPSQAFDKEAYGGVSRLVLDRQSGERVSSNLVLTGTLRNCAGGPSPWGWLSCEESTEQGHGYVFLCSTEASSLEQPRPIFGYGRFNHEAVCVDPKTSIAYLTEDRNDSCLYRFVPYSHRHPFRGRLQALRHRTVPAYSVSDSLRADRSIQVDWVDLPDPNPKDDTLRLQAQEKGAALIRRGEGIWFDSDSVYICSTNGGQNGTGQILKLRVGRDANIDTLELVAESASSSELDHPDNICVSPWGDVLIAEDGFGDQYIRAITKTGRIVDVARNTKSNGELTGVCFAPDGRTLFVNLQADGLTLAIQGPLNQLVA